MIALSNTPVLTTERLTLRAPQASDWPVWRDFAASDRARFIGGPHVVPGTAWRAFGHVIGHWVLRGFGSFVFCDKGTGAPLGMAGPWYPDGWPEREIGWTVWTPQAEGKGYAHEAVVAARAYAFDALGWDTAVSYIDALNDRSVALAERLGARRDDGADHPGGKPCLVYRHTKGTAA